MFKYTIKTAKPFTPIKYEFARSDYSEYFTSPSERSEAYDLEKKELIFKDEVMYKNLDIKTNTIRQIISCICDCLAILGIDYKNDSKYDMQKIIYNALAHDNTYFSQKKPARYADSYISINQSISKLSYIKQIEPDSNNIFNLSDELYDLLSQTPHMELDLTSAENIQILRPFITSLYQSFDYNAIISCYDNAIAEYKAKYGDFTSIDEYTIHRDEKKLLEKIYFDYRSHYNNIAKILEAMYDLFERYDEISDLIQQNNDVMEYEAYAKYLKDNCVYRFGTSIDKCAEIFYQMDEYPASSRDLEIQSKALIEKDLAPFNNHNVRTNEDGILKIKSNVALKNIIDGEGKKTNVTYNKITEMPKSGIIKRSSSSILFEPGERGFGLGIMDEEAAICGLEPVSENRTDTSDPMIFFYTTPPGRIFVCVPAFYYKIHSEDIDTLISIHQPKVEISYEYKEGFNIPYGFLKSDGTPVPCVFIEARSTGIFASDFRQGLYDTAKGIRFRDIFNANEYYFEYRGERESRIMGTKTYDLCFMYLPLYQAFNLLSMAHVQACLKKYGGPGSVPSDVSLLFKNKPLYSPYGGISISFTEEQYSELNNEYLWPHSYLKCPKNEYGLGIIGLSTPNTIGYLKGIDLVPKLNSDNIMNEEFYNAIECYRSHFDGWVLPDSYFDETLESNGYIYNNLCIPKRIYPTKGAQARFDGLFEVENYAYSNSISTGRFGKYEQTYKTPFGYPDVPYNLPKLNGVRGMVWENNVDDIMIDEPSGKTYINIGAMTFPR